MPNKTSSANEPQHAFPPQHQQRQPGREHLMQPKPRDTGRLHHAGRLRGKRAVITGGDSGIGRAVAVAFAAEGADVAILYLEEDADADATREMVEQQDRRCTLIRGDIRQKDFCRSATERAAEFLQGIDVLVNNAAVQYPVDDIRQISDDQLRRTFETNIFSIFYMTQAALEHLEQRNGASIINSTSVTAYRGHNTLLDYAATKGAIVSFTRSLSGNLAPRGIRVNAVAPGPIWTPLIPASFPADKVEKFGTSVPLGRAGQPDECAGCYVFLASDEASYMTGQVLHPNGGEIVNG